MRTSGLSHECSILALVVVVHGGIFAPNCGVIAAFASHHGRMGVGTERPIGGLWQPDLGNARRAEERVHGQRVARQRAARLTSLLVVLIHQESLWVIA